MVKHKKLYDDQISMEVYLTGKLKIDPQLEIIRNIDILNSDIYMQNFLSLAVMNNTLMDLSANEYIKNKNKINKYMRKLFKKIIQLSV